MITTEFFDTLTQYGVAINQMVDAIKPIANVAPVSAEEQDVPEEIDNEFDNITEDEVVE